MTKTQNTFEQHLRLAASYTSKEAADHEEPEIDLARMPSDDHHRMGDGDLHAVIPHICHFFTRAKFLENKIYTEKRQFFTLNL